MSQETDTDNEERTRNFLLYKVRLTDQEMADSRENLPNWAINLCAVVLLLVLGALGYLCIFHLK